MSCPSAHLEDSKIVYACLNHNRRSCPLPRREGNLIEWALPLMINKVIYHCMNFVKFRFSSSLLDCEVPVTGMPPFETTLSCNHSTYTLTPHPSALRLVILNSFRNGISDLKELVIRKVTLQWCCGTTDAAQVPFRCPELSLKSTIPISIRQNACLNVEVASSDGHCDLACNGTCNGATTDQRYWEFSLHYSIFNVNLLINFP
jgi:hypothetical protein